MEKEEGEDWLPKMDFILHSHAIFPWKEVIAIPNAWTALRGYRKSIENISCDTRPNCITTYSSLIDYSLLIWIDDMNIRDIEMGMNQFLSHGRWVGKRRNQWMGEGKRGERWDIREWPITRTLCPEKESLREEFALILVTTVTYPEVDVSRITSWLSSWILSFILDIMINDALTIHHEIVRFKTVSLYLVDWYYTLLRNDYGKG